MPSQAAAARQQTLEQGSDSGEEIYDDELGPDGKGKKKGSTSQAARRDQNRIAQREFRLRKQQRIRDLELRVELLSANKDEAFTSMDGMVQDLNRENQALRQLVRDLSSFIGEGIGGFLPKLGWDINTFEEFKNRGETDTMNDSYQSRKKNPNLPAPVVPLLAGQKRRTEDAAPISRKKSKPNTLEDAGTSTSNGSTQHPSLNQMSSAQIYSNPHPSTSNVYNREFPTNPPNSGTNSYLPTASANPTGGAPPQLAPLITNTGSSNVSGLNLYNTTPTNSAAPNSAYPPPMRMASSSDASTPSLTTATTTLDDAAMARHREAARLIHYHLSNYKRNSAYCLPASLRPTHVQRTIAHDYVVDGVIYADLRDKMIRFQGTFDLAECTHLMMTTSTIHTDDLLTHANWELSEEWFSKFGHLATMAMLDITNKWRRERKEPEIPATVLEDKHTYEGP